jgi:hypothetical protein
MTFEVFQQGNMSDDNVVEGKRAKGGAAPWISRYGLQSVCFHSQSYILLAMTPVDGPLPTPLFFILGNYLTLTTYMFSSGSEQDKTSSHDMHSYTSKSSVSTS